MRFKDIEDIKEELQVDSNIEDTQIVFAKLPKNLFDNPGIEFCS